MAETPFEATVRLEPSQSIAIIDLRGDVNVLAEDALNAAYAKTEAADVPRILMNFAGVDYINSSGIALIVGVLTRARQQHRAVSACNLSSHYREIFDITRLSDFISVYADEQAAIAGIPSTR